jgi:hypothetical protein
MQCSFGLNLLHVDSRTYPRFSRVLLTPPLIEGYDVDWRPIGFKDQRAKSRSPAGLVLKKRNQNSFGGVWRFLETWDCMYGSMV